MSTELRYKNFHPITERTLGDSLSISTRIHSSKTIVSSEEGNFSYRELLQRATALAYALQQHGMQRGDRVAIYMDNSWPAIYSLYGIILARGVFVVINPQTKPDKLAYILDDCDAKILLTDSCLKDSFLPILKRTTKLSTIFYTGEKIPLSGTIASIEHLDSVLDNNSTSHIHINCIPTDLASLVYTSGSTGLPKGVMQTT